MVNGKKNSKRKNDILFIGILLLTATLVGLLFLIMGKAGDTVTVTVDKKFFGEYPLGEDRIVEIRTEDSLNILVIEDGRAFMREADCPDGICCAHRPIVRDGESIICLPNRVVVTVSAKSENGPDVVA